MLLLAGLPVSRAGKRIPPWQQRTIHLQSAGLRYVSGADSILFWVDFSTPGTLDRRKVLHGIELRVAPAADTARSVLLSAVHIQGAARSRYIRRQLRRAGEEAPPVAWSETHKIKRREWLPMRLRVVMPHQPFITQEPVVVMMYQYHSADYKGLVLQLPVQITEPEIRLIDRRPAPLPYNP